MGNVQWITGDVLGNTRGLYIDDVRGNIKDHIVRYIEILRMCEEKMGCTERFGDVVENNWSVLPSWGTVLRISDCGYPS